MAKTSYKKGSDSHKKWLKSSVAYNDPKRIISKADNKAAKAMVVDSVDGETGKRKHTTGDKVLRENVTRSSLNEVDGGNRKMIKVKSAYPREKGKSVFQHQMRDRSK